MKNGNKPAGGLGSRNVKNVSVKTGQPRREVSPRGVSQVGQALGNHSTEKRRPSPNAVETVVTGKKGISVPLGNEIAGNVGCGGPGRGYVQYGKSGSQQSYGPTNPGLARSGNAGRDILNDYGRDAAIVSTRK